MDTLEASAARSYRPTHVQPTGSDPAGPSHHSSEPAGHQPRPASPEAVRDSVDIAESMMSLMRSHSQLRARLSSHQDSDLGGAILLLKLQKGGPRRASDLASELCSDPSTVSRQVAGLVRAGLLERKADPEDGRASILWLTASGQLRAGEHRTLRGEAMAPIFSDWSAEDRTTFIRLLRSYASGLEQHREQILVGLAAVSDVSTASAPDTSPVPAVPAPVPPSEFTPVPIPPAAHHVPAERFS